LDIAVGIGQVGCAHTIWAAQICRLRPNGWFDIRWRLCEDLEPLVMEMKQRGGPKFEVLQVKQEFGGLRFYANCSRDEAIRQRIGIAAASPSALARFAVSREHCGKLVGSRLCAMNPRVHGKRKSDRKQYE
jgi:hypothetical protein